MRQCPDCEEKDRVVIAGKVFCATCGTPWQPTDQTEEKPYLAKVGLLKEDTPAPDAPAPVPTPPVVPAPEVAPPQPVAPVVPPVQSPPLGVEQATVVSAPLPAVAPVPDAPREVIGSEIPTLDSRTEDVLSDSALKEMSQLPSVAPAAPAPPLPEVFTPPAVAAPEKVPETTLSPASVPVATDAPAPAPEPPVSTPSDVAAIPVVAPPASIPTPAPVEASIPVSAPASAPVSSGPPGASVDSIVAPTAPAAAVIASAPAPVAPTTTPTPAATQTTVEGITMSRDAALKLALGDSAPAAPTGPARPLAVVLSVIGLVMLGAYFWQANYPAVALKIAGIRSGINVAVPTYLPSGWNLSRQITSREGAISYKVVKNDQSFEITEQETAWDSQALLEQYVLPRSKEYLALQAEGLTIYVFGDNQATWVSNGMVHKLEGAHSLSQDEIIRIATSL